MKNLVILFAISLFSFTASAGDRVMEVQSRVTAAMGNILDKKEYLVVVNRIDSLDAVGGQAVVGHVRALPGLRVGVDEEGQVVVKDGLNAAYSGPVSVTVVIDNEVEMETYRAIETLLPEIMGGARGGDEIKIKRAVLKQPAEEPQPQVVINNAPPQIDPKQLSGSGDLIKIGALFFLGLGAMLWMLSRRPGDSPAHPRTHPRSEPSHDKSDSKKGDWNPTAFDGFDPEVLGLYLLKCVSDGDVVRARCFLGSATPTVQKAALSAMPSWCASHCLEKIERKENAPEGTGVDPDAILRELTVLEKTVKDDPTAKATALIQWIPAEAMNNVHPESLAAPSDATRYAVISLRPDLARSFKYDENDALVAGLVFNAKAIAEAGAELHKWKTRLVVARNAKTSVVDAMAGIINQTQSFNEIDQKLRNIQKKLSKLDWEALQPKIVSRGTFLDLTDLQKKDLLRAMEPADFFYLVKELNECGDWQLDGLLRPKRLAAFRAAETLDIHLEWTDEQKAAANGRVLQQLRAVCLGESNDGREESSAA